MGHAPLSTRSDRGSTPRPHPGARCGSVGPLGPCPLSCHCPLHCPCTALGAAPPLSLYHSPDSHWPLPLPRSLILTPPRPAAHAFAPAPAPARLGHRGREGRGEGGREYGFVVSGLWMTRPRLRHMRGSQPPQGGLLGPAVVGRSGQPVAAPRATGGQSLPSFIGGGGGLRFLCG